MNNWTRLVLLLLGLIALFAPAIALADQPSMLDRPYTWSPNGMAVSVGGGFIQFTDASANAAAPLGASWTARFTYGTRSHLGWEAAYLGTVQSMATLGFDNRGTLYSNGLEGAVRLNALTGDWQPYFSAGVGWRRYGVSTLLGNTSSIADHDDAAELPLSLGLAWRYRGLIADLRAELRPVLANALMPGTPTTTWGMGARVGFEF